MRYILFTKDGCSFCSNAVDFLKNKQLDFSVIDFSPEQESVLIEIKKAHDWPTVPMIFTRNGQDIKFIGGYSDLLKLFEIG